MNFEQVKSPRIENKNGQIVVACPQMKTNVNISALARSASCLGVSEFIVTGNNSINAHIAKGIEVPIKHHRSILPVIKKYKGKGYKIIGLEQTNNSNDIYGYTFPSEPVMLIVGHECRGMEPEILNELDEAVEIPLHRNPHSLNVAIAASICLFEYAKQQRG